MFRVVVGDGAPLVDRDTGAPTTTEYYEVALVTDVPRYVAIARARAKTDDDDGNEKDCDDDRTTTREAVTFRAHKRYSAFEALHRALTARGRHEARLPTMPKKALVRTPAVRETRREGFQFILDAVGRDRELRACDEVVEFFTSAGTGGARERATLGVRGDAGGVEGSRTDGERDNDASAGEDDDDDDDDDAPNPRRGVGLESLMRSTMRVHGTSDALGERGEGEARRDDSSGSAFEEEEMRETTTRTTTMQTTPMVTSSFMLNRATLLTTNGGVANGNDGLASYDASSAGAREAIKANDAIGLERLLDEHGVDVNAKDNSGMTLLHLACLFNRKHAVDALLRHGADATLRNAQGETASELAPPTLAFAIAKALKKS